MLKVTKVEKVEDRDYTRRFYRPKKVRVYFSVKGENILQNLALRTIRPNKLYRKFLPEVLKQAGFEVGYGDNVKAYWDQRAGCSCPCSPGFVVQSEARGFNIWVTLEGDTPEETNAAKFDAAKVNPAFESRVEQILSDPTLPFKQGGVVAEAEARRLDLMLPPSPINAPVLRETEGGAIVETDEARIASAAARSATARANKVDTPEAHSLANAAHTKAFDAAKAAGDHETAEAHRSLVQEHHLRSQTAVLNLNKALGQNRATDSGMIEGVSSSDLKVMRKGMSETEKKDILADVFREEK